MTTAEAPQFIRRPKHPLPPQIDVQAVAVAHHRYFCRGDDPDNCTQVDQDDLDYAEQLSEILDHLPPVSI